MRSILTVMTAAELLKNNNPTQALKALEDAVRKDPSDSKLRVFLFQLLCILGNWERALTQLGVIGEMDRMAMLMVRTCQAAIQCEALRAQVFTGQRSPLIFGEPADWIAQLVQAAALDAQGKPDAAMAMRDAAFEAAPASSGMIEVATGPDSVESHPFEFIADTDVRMGPMLEAIVDGKYYWVPFSRISLIRIEKPTDLRDLVWTACQFVWTSGGQSVGFIPTRYPGTEKLGTDLERMSAQTRRAEDAGAMGGEPLGARVLATDGGEFSLLSIRSITLNPQ